MNRIYSKTIHSKANVFKWCLIFGALIPVIYLQTFPAIRVFYTYSCLGIFIWCCYLFIDGIKGNTRPGKMFALAALVTIFPFCVNVIIRNNIPFSSLNYIFRSLAFAFLMGFYNKHFWDKLQGLRIVLNVFVIINFLTMMLFPDGLYATEKYTNNWFLGYKNDIMFYIMLALCVNCIVSVHFNGKYGYKTWLLYAISLISILKSESSTSLVVIVAWGLIMVFLQKKKLPRFLNFRNIAIATIAITVGIVFYGIQENFSFLIEDVLGKDLTMTGRIVVWERAIECISERPLFGYGYMTELEWQDCLDLPFGSMFMFSHPHNYLLYTWIESGFIGLLILGYYYYNIGKITSSHTGNMGCKLMAFFILIFLIEGITESLNHYQILLPFMVLIQPICNEQIEYKR